MIGARAKRTGLMILGPAERTKATRGSVAMENTAVQKRDANIEEAIRLLPPELQDQVRDFIRSLLDDQPYDQEPKPKLDWRGALRELREQYTSIELEDKALEWWES
jgi:hypothetical protein